MTCLHGKILGIRIIVAPTESDAKMIIHNKSYYIVLHVSVFFSNSGRNIFFTRFVNMLKVNTVLLLICCFADSRASTYRNSNAGLTSVPVDIPTYSKIVVLKQNALTIISAPDFSLLSALKQLFLNDNDITNISTNAFRNNTHLELLDLSGNPIKTVPFFMAIASTLKTLTMKNCEISNITWDQKIHYTGLVNLDLENNHLTAVPDMTKSSLTLKTLSLGSNNIEVLNPSKLNVCQQMGILVLRSNNMKSINGNLNLSNLRNLYLYNNLLTHFPYTSDLPKLQYITLYDNKIDSITNDFSNNQELTHLSLDKNRLSQMPNLDAVKDTLLDLRLSYSRNITSIPVDYFKGFTKLSHLELKGISETSISFARSFGPSLSYLNIRNSKITTVPAGTFVNATGLTTVDMSKNRINYFDISNIQYMPKLLKIYISRNALTTIGNAYTYCNGTSCTNLEIDLSHNLIPCDKRMCWAKFNATITVVMNNCIGKQWNDMTVHDLDCIPSKCFSF